MDYRTKDFSIEVHNNIFKYTGSMDIEEYKEVNSFLGDCLNHIGTENIVLDIKNLYFLNSTGIRSLSHFLVNCGRNVIVNIDKEKPWQRINIYPLSQLDPARVKII